MKLNMYYIIIEVLFLVLLGLSIYNFVKIYVYKEDDILIQSVYNIMFGIVLLFASAFLYYLSRSLKLAQASFIKHISFFLFLTGFVNILNSAKVLSANKDIPTIRLSNV